MRKFRTVAATIVETVNGLGIVRCEEYLVNQNDKLIGHKRVWFDVCRNNGEGDIIESRKTLSAARRAAKDWSV